MITDANGWVAVKYLQQIPHVIEVHGNEYAFVVKFNINLTWIRPEDLDQVLAIKKECCGGSKRPKYFLANALDVQRWTQ